MLTVPVGSTPTAGQVFTADGLGGAAFQNPASSSIPSGSIILITAGTCPAGFAEATELNGFTVIGTVAANGDIGTTGGSNTITPTGMVDAPTFTGNALGTHTHGIGSYVATAPTFTGSSGTIPAETISYPVNVPTNSSITISGSTGSEAAHTHSVTAAGTNGTGAVSGTSGTEAAHTHSVTSNATATVNEPNFTITGTKMTTSSSGTAAATAFNGTTIASGATTVANPAQTVTVTNNQVTSGAGSSHSHGAGSYVAAAETFTGSAVTSGAGSSHLHSAGTLAASTPAISWPANPPTNSTVSFTPSGTNSTPALSGTSGAASAGTPTGTNSAPAFTGNSADNRSAFVKVIFCKKT